MFPDFVYVSDWRLEAVIKFHKVSGNMEEIVAREPQNSRLYGVKIFSESGQAIDLSNPCLPDYNYGGCEKLCFAVPSNTSSSSSSLNVNI